MLLVRLTDKFNVILLRIVSASVVFPLSHGLLHHAQQVGTGMTVKEGMPVTNDWGLHQH